jgi:hypothetical protein
MNMMIMMVNRSNSTNALTPYIVLHDEREKTCLLIDIALPYDSDVNTKETEKLIKWKDLEIGVSRMWYKWRQKLEHRKQIRSD